MYRILIVLFIVVLTAGCSSAQETMTPPAQNPTSKHEVAHASAKIIDKTGKQIGIAEFTEAAGGVQMQVTASTIMPGKHGFHIHAMGKCTPPDFKSAKGHFNPTHKEHGKDNPQGKHLGDLLNLVADEQGNVKGDAFIEDVTLKPDLPQSLRHPEGTAVVIHQQADDYKTNPSGNSGSRIACGVIE